MFFTYFLFSFFYYSNRFYPECFMFYVLCFVIFFDDLIFSSMMLTESLTICKFSAIKEGLVKCYQVTKSQSRELCFSFLLARVYFLTFKLSNFQT